MSYHNRCSGKVKIHVSCDDYGSCGVEAKKGMVRCSKVFGPKAVRVAARRARTDAALANLLAERALGEAEVGSKDCQFVASYAKRRRTPSLKGLGRRFVVSRCGKKKR